MPGEKPRTRKQQGRARRPQQAPPPPLEPREGFTALGIVVKPHSLAGEVRVHAFNPEAPHLQAGATIWIGAATYVVARARSDKGTWILDLEGVDDRSQAESLRGSLIEAPDESVTRADDEYFVHELIGLAVKTDEGADVGRVTEVLQPGANDVYVVTMASGREVLVPVTEEVVRTVDLAAGLIVITPLAGMLDESGY